MLLRTSLVALLAAALILPASAVAKGKPQKAASYIVVLDAGHGGSDIGAASAFGALVENQLTLQVATLAAGYLQARGYTVYVDRSRDQGVNTPARDLNHDGKIDRVDEFDARTLFANHHHADLFVSIHFDASADPAIHGTHGYYCPARPFWKQSRYLATLLTHHIADDLRRAGYKSPDNGVETDVADVVPQTRADYPWFLVLGPSRHNWLTGTAMPGALIESLYLTSQRDANALEQMANVRAIARGYSDGVRAYFGWKSHR